MQIFPAIDLRDGKAVRLLRGDYEQMTVYSAQPCGVARRFIRAGARRLHLVDLDGAKDGTPSMANWVEIGALVQQGHAFIEVGGGIRTEERILQYLDLGVDRCILGTAAVEDFSFTERMAKRYREKIAVGVDARDGLVATHGWLKTSDTDSFDFCRRLRDAGVQTVIYTDISKDGALSGTNLDAYRRLSGIEGLDIVASGGISDICEIRALREIGAAGAILGKAVYDGKLDLGMCLDAAEDRRDESDDEPALF
ncbi:1-(5-phosphoribosyl)-5-[(5-phosphoribosylamino)methylideneamino] imidazole-4-carboxamide isomerase [anaerobic digester metagenome]|jgi:phosphoribosylformimino-5-aminoimidazole carboxamide ribotide isomerase|uniref:1-(5-phosphoribosyl)-5-[(5- phosphoribosylamino)methylideneamino]imidazole-4- carboxamide isomerase n=1 Tax=Oscillibacter ruminantium TaxID=1263547 RepID=UPI0002F9CCED|nr:1-(5-phosphoribosyl)-5-[(5-phosphoribosylamino)methylideneamino]imidazole-4-carboxamide isomerase [Oscillibacter ruminantium]